MGESGIAGFLYMWLLECCSALTVPLLLNSSSGLRLVLLGIMLDGHFRYCTHTIQTWSCALVVNSLFVDLSSSATASFVVHAGRHLVKTGRFRW